jgi:hypothetical protein
MSWTKLEFALIDKGNQFSYSLPIRKVRLAVGLLQPGFLDRDQSAEQHHVDDEHSQESGRSEETPEVLIRRQARFDH